MSAESERAAAERHAAALVAEHGLPSGYEGVVTLLAVAYLQGFSAGIAWTQNAHEQAERRWMTHP